MLGLKLNHVSKMGPYCCNWNIRKNYAITGLVIPSHRKTYHKSCVFHKKNVFAYTRNLWITKWEQMNYVFMLLICFPNIFHTPRASTLNHQFPPFNIFNYITLHNLMNGWQTKRLAYPHELLDSSPIFQQPSNLLWQAISCRLASSCLL